MKQSSHKQEVKPADKQKNREEKRKRRKQQCQKHAHGHGKHDGAAHTPQMLGF